MKDMQTLIDRTVWITIEELTEFEDLYDSLLFRLIQISENSEKLTPAFKESHKEISWQAIKDMSNRIVKEYEDVEIGAVYQMVTEHIPLLFYKLEQII